MTRLSKMIYLFLVKKKITKTFVKTENFSRYSFFKVVQNFLVDNKNIHLLFDQGEAYSLNNSQSSWLITVQLLLPMSQSPFLIQLLNSSRKFCVLEFVRSIPFVTTLHKILAKLFWNCPSWMNSSHSASRWNKSSSVENPFQNFLNPKGLEVHFYPHHLRATN